MASTLPLDPQEPVNPPDLQARVARLEEEVVELRAMLGERTQAPPPLPLPVKPFEPAAQNRLPVTVPHFSADVPRSRSLESDLGAKVLSKVAVLLLLVGAAWFLKWAFDNRWIGPAGRVMIGLLSGAGVVVWSERFRRTGTPSFAYALKAVGTGVLYLSLWASFQLYHQMPAWVALLAMIAVTAWNATLALTQDSRLLAGYALLGAYLTPVLLSSGGNHEVFLLLYLVSVAIAVGALLRARAWNVLLLVPLPVTALFFVAWYVQCFDAKLAGITTLLTLLLWAIFAAIPLVAREGQDVIAGVLQPIGAALFAALTMYAVLIRSDQKSAEPWWALGFAAAYLAASRVRRGTIVSAMHLSLALSFLTIAIPLKLTGHGITIGWFAESLAALWIAGTLDLDARARAALEWLGIASMLLAAGGALLGPEFFGQSAHAFGNRAFLTSIGVVVALIVAMLLLRRLPPSVRAAPDPLAVTALFLVLMNVVLLVAMNREIVRALAGSNTADFAFSGWMAVQGAAMLAAGFWKRAALARWIGLLLLAITIVKMVVYDMRSLGTGYRVVSYLALGVLLMVVSFAYQKDWLGLRAIAEEPDATEREG
jgi:uncharacterized membrane protein